MKKIILILFMFFYLVPLSVFARAWVQVDDNDFIDKDSIKIYINDKGEYEFNKKIFWTKHVGNDMYKELEKSLNKKISYGVSQQIIDYTNQTIAIKAGAVFDKDGNTLNSYTISKDYQLQWNAIIPDSKGELWYKLVNKPRILKRIYKTQTTLQ